MIKKERIDVVRTGHRGFTLIEILIVVAIIAILASVVLVGLGPTQSLGRDARRVSDLHEVQNGLELYYNAKGQYPIGGNNAWSNLGTALSTAVPSITSIPSDPSSNRSYAYSSDASGLGYILQAQMENLTGGPWSGYNPPTASYISQETKNYYGNAMPDCAGTGQTGSTSGDFCVTL